MNKNISTLFEAGRILDSINDGVYVTDTQRRIVYWNKAAQTITGWTKDQVVGSSCRDDILCHVDKEEQALCGKEKCPLYRCMKTGQPSRSPMIVYAKNAQGNRIPVEVTVAPIYDDQNQIIGGAEVFRDLSGSMDDLLRARKIQQQALKWQFDHQTPVQASVHYIPHDMIGGDFYAVQSLNDHQVVFFLADVMGHGAAAALYTMYLRTLFDEYYNKLPDIQSFMESLNFRLHQLMNGNHSFAASICGMIDTKTCQMSITGGTQTPVFYYHGRNPVQKVVIKGFLLGMMEDVTFPPQTLSFSPGDTVFMYTDGAIENKDVSNQALGDDGLLDILQQWGYPETKIKLEEIEMQIIEKASQISLSDDVTLLEFKWPKQ